MDQQMIAGFSASPVAARMENHGPAMLKVAMTSGQEARQGSITAGKVADLTIFDRDIFTIPPDELIDVGIAATVVGGEFKHRTGNL